MWKAIPAESAHNPYSRVLEGHHLSIRPAPRADRARKSPSIVEPIGEPIRNATRTVFHNGNSSKKEKRTKKEKQNGLWKMPQLWKSPKQSVAFGTFFLMRIPTAAWKSLAKTLGFPTFTTGPTTADHYGNHLHYLNTIRGAAQRRGGLFKAAKRPYKCSRSAPY
jgi:hypothetical protein